MVHQSLNARRRRLLLAGEEDCLRRLPPGEWIGGTIPYFMTSSGGQVSREGIFVTEVPPEVTGIRIASHDGESLAGIAQEAPENGFTFLVLPAGSDVHLRYAHDAPDYPQMYLKPIVGWVAGVHLEDLGRALGERPREITLRSLDAEALCEFRKQLYVKDEVLRRYLAARSSDRAARLRVWVERTIWHPARQRRRR